MRARRQARAVIQARKPLAAAEFDLDPELFNHVEDIPREIQADVMFFMLNGRRPKANGAGGVSLEVG